MLRALSGTTRFILLLLALLLSVIFLLPKQTRSVLQTVGQPISAVVFLPIEALTTLEQSVIGLWQEYVALRHVREDNRQLRRDLEVLQRQNSDLRESAIAAQRLESLLEFKEQFVPHTVAARVMGRDSTNWYSSVILNKGDRDGIRPEMGVMTSAGIVGRVVKTGPFSSIVLLVTDPHNAITGIIQRSRDEGIVEGTSQGRARIKYLPLLANIRVGDIVVTSGLTGGFPRGIVIGTVLTMQKEEGELFQSAEIAPQADLSKLEEVLIITVPRSLETQSDEKSK
ncbi:MAG TPA: rod shape-determining protein MreC [Nitrospiraceae bacterium]|jgi:rod shape-determining protein MreC|nr:rod shape-determining protein MreC [Nitrospiraceae bacterium]